MNTAITTIKYPIVETFHSVQGEGYWMGVNAFFIRLGGCDVHCSWCDTKHSWNASRHPLVSPTELANIALKVDPSIIVITGGEPLIHDLVPLTTALHQAGLQVHLETSGAHPYSGTFDWVTFSPKKFKAPHHSIYEHVNEIKVVIKNEYDFKWAEQQAVLIPDSALLYLQPEWNTITSKDLIVKYILHNSQWRVSLQTHKLLQIQ